MAKFVLHVWRHASLFGVPGQQSANSAIVLFVIGKKFSSWMLFISENVLKCSTTKSKQTKNFIAFFRRYFLLCFLMFYFSLLVLTFAFISFLCVWIWRWVLACALQALQAELFSWVWMLEVGEKRDSKALTVFERSIWWFTRLFYTQGANLLIFSPCLSLPYL